MLANIAAAGIVDPNCFREVITEQVNVGCMLYSHMPAACTSRYYSRITVTVLHAALGSIHSSYCS